MTVSSLRSSIRAAFHNCSPGHRPQTELRVNYLSAFFASDLDPGRSTFPVPGVRPGSVEQTADYKPEPP